jgi:hypothetical protein
MNKIKDEDIVVNSSNIMQCGYKLKGVERENLMKKNHVYYVISDNSHVFIMRLLSRIGLSDYIVNAYSYINQHHQTKEDLIKNAEDLSSEWNLSLKP